MTELLDPPAPPEPEDRMRAADLLNKVCLFRPRSHVIDASREGQPGRDGKPMKAWEYVACDVWVLDRAGIVEEGTDVRVSWWRSVAQLKDAIGSFVAGKPTTQDDKSVILVALSGEARTVAERVITEIPDAPAAGPIDANVPPPSYDDFGEEPF